MILGLLTQKPGRDPVVGEVKNYVVLNMPALGEKKAWVKIKNPSQDNPGAPHKIVKLTPTYTDSTKTVRRTDSYGNISFNIEIEPTTDAVTHSNPPPQQRNVAGGMSKDDYWTRKEQRDIEGVSRMGRAHSQEMALRFFQMSGGIPGATTPAEITEKLRTMIDWFERDIEYSQTGVEEQ